VQVFASLTVVDEKTHLFWNASEESSDVCVWFVMKRGRDEIDHIQSEAPQEERE
jgi:hypothetical protein